MKKTCKECEKITNFQFNVAYGWQCQSCGILDTECCQDCGSDKIDKWFQMNNDKLHGGSECGACGVVKNNV